MRWVKTTGEFEHILETQGPGTSDDAIPAVCRERGAGVLMTVNVRDFGAKKHYYQALLDAGVSVVVLRPGKVRFDPLGQVDLVTHHLRRVFTLLQEAALKTLVVVNQSEARIRTLEELVAEIQ